MANRTAQEAVAIKGTNPQYLVEKITRTKIYASPYWKEKCFGLSAETLVDRAVELEAIGGSYGGNRKPSHFLCLVLKMLQLQPERDIVIEFIKQEDYKYVRALGAFYFRLIFQRAEEVYQYLEPLLNDYRKLRIQTVEGKYIISHMDEFVDELLREERACDIKLPFLQKRRLLEESGLLEPRVSVLEDMLDEIGVVDNEEPEKPSEQPSSADKGGERDSATARSSDRQRSRSRDRYRRRSSSRDRHGRHRSRSRDRYRRSRSRDRRYDERYDRSRSRERGRDHDRRRSRSRDRGRSYDRDHGRYHSRERSRDRRRRSRSRSRSHERYRRDGRKRSRSRSPRPHDGPRENGEVAPARAEAQGDAEKKKRRKKQPEGSAGPSSAPAFKEKKRAGEVSMSIEETNKMRASLGLPPLK